MPDLASVGVGAAATLLGVCGTGTFGAILQSRAARHARNEERRTDLRGVVDDCVVALADCEFCVSIANIRAQAFAAGHELEPYLEIEADVNASVRGLRTASGRLAVRAPDETQLKDAFAEAMRALVHHRERVRDSVDARHLAGDLETVREVAERAVLRFHDAGAAVVGPELPEHLRT